MNYRAALKVKLGDIAYPRITAWDCRQYYKTKRPDVVVKIDNDEINKEIKFTLENGRTYRHTDIEKVIQELITPDCPYVLNGKCIGVASCCLQAKCVFYRQDYEPTTEELLEAFAEDG